MNRIYKLKYDRRRNQMVAVSELTTGAGKESTGQIVALVDSSVFRRLSVTLTPLAFLTGLVMSFLPVMALANPDLPVGGNIVAGQGNISTSGNQMTINQNTHGMVTNWNSFDIGKHNTVQFIQPDSSAIALNRVTGGHESQILGTLTANGQVMLVNPAGVMFGKGAKVNSAGLVASTKNISDADFMAGHYTFSGGGNTGAEVVNQGSLTTTKGGYIVLAADRVKNSGTVRTPGGKTILAAGETVTLQLDNSGLTSVSVKGSMVNALVENRGLLSATDGQVWLTARGKDMLLNTVVNNSGTIEAGGLTRHGGDIVLDGGESGVVSQSGMLLADSDTGRGGNVTLEGQNIHLAAGSHISATGKTGGGEVHVGGGWQGRDSHIRNASKVVMDKSAIVDVSASEKGNGGTAVLWSDDYTDFQGAILAKGGTRSGNGGRVETSSHNNLQAFGDVDASAPGGKGGRWLLDPTDVTIVTDAGNTGISETEQNPEHIFSPVASGAKVSAQKIAEQLNKDTSVTVKTGGVDTEGQKGNITIANNVHITKDAGSGEATLTLLADNNISIGSDVAINAKAGKLNLNLLAGNTASKTSIIFSRKFGIDLNGGDFLAGSAINGHSVVFQTPHADGSMIRARNITLNTEMSSIASLALNATNNITVNGPVKATAGYNRALTWSAGNLLKITAPTGNISFTAVGDQNGNGPISLKGLNGISIQAERGNITLKSQSSKGKKGTLNITSDKNIALVASTGSILADNVTSMTSSDGDILLKSGEVVGVINNTNIRAAGNLSVLIKGKPTTHYVFSVVDSVLHADKKLNVSVDGKTTDYFDLLYLSHATFDGENINIGLKGVGRAAEIYGINTFNGDLIFDANTTAKYNECTPSSVLIGGGSKVIVKGNANIASKTDGQGGKGSALFLSGGINATGDLTLRGESVDNSTGIITANNGKTIEAGGKLTLNGISEGGTAVRVTKGNITGNSVVVHGEASAGGTGVYVSDGVKFNNAIVTGKTDTGSGIDVAGNLTTDNTILSGQASGQGSGVVIRGNVSGGKILGQSATGSGVFVSGESSTITDAVIIGSTMDGQGVNITGNLTNVGSTGVSGHATGSGSGISLSGNVAGGNVTGRAEHGTGISVNGNNSSVTNVVLNGNATSGTGVLLGSGTTLGSSTIKGSTESGKGVDITGTLVNTSDTDIEGHSTGTGTGVNVAGDITGGTVSGTAEGTGTGVSISGTDVTVSDVAVTGRTEGGTGVSVSGGLTIKPDATVSGLATGGGTGVVTDGRLNGDIHGSSSSGVGIRVSDGADITQGSNASGHSESGTGAYIKGRVTNQGVIAGESVSGSGAYIGGDVTGEGSITGISKEGGEGVILAGSVTDGRVEGQSSTGTGLSINAGSTLINASGSGKTETGIGVHVKGDLVNSGNTTVTGISTGKGTGTLLSGNVMGGVVSGRSADGVGVDTGSDIILSEVVVNGTSATHNGVRVNGHVSNVGSVVISGNSENGAGVSLDGAVSGGALKGHSVSGPGLQVTGESRINGVEVTSSSEHGPGVQMDGALSSSGSSLNGQHIQDTVVVNAARQTAYQQQGVISHTERQGHAVIASGYRGQDKPVSVEICTDGKCSMLDAGSLVRPARQ